MDIVWVVVTCVVFAAFMGMLVIVFWPSKGKKPYENAEKLALKEDSDPVITPRRQHSSDKRTET